MVLVRVALSVRRRLHRLPLFRHVIPLRRMSLQDACSILEVELNADRKAVKEAYFEKAKTYHPDNQVTGDAQMFRQVRKAYNLLQHGVPDGAARAQSQWRGNFDEEQQRRRRSQFEQFRRRQYEEARRAQEQKEDFEKLLRHFWRSMRNILSRQRKNFASLWEGEFKWATMAVGIFSVPLFFIALYGNRESLSDTMGRAAARKNITQRELFNQEGQKLFAQISARCDDATYSTILADYRAHILSARKTPPSVIKTRDVIRIDALFKRFPTHAAELLNSPIAQAVGYTLGQKDDVSSTETTSVAQPTVVNYQAAHFDRVDLEAVVKLYLKGEKERALFLMNNPEALAAHRKSSGRNNLTPATSSALSSAWNSAVDKTLDGLDGAMDLLAPYLDVFVYNWRLFVYILRYDSLEQLTCEQFLREMDRASRQDADLNL